MNKLRWYHRPAGNAEQLVWIKVHGGGGSPSEGRPNVERRPQCHGRPSSPLALVMILLRFPPGVALPLPPLAQYRPMKSCDVEDRQLLSFQKPSSLPR